RRRHGHVLRPPGRRAGRRRAGPVVRRARRGPQRRARRRAAVAVNVPGGHPRTPGPGGHPRTVGRDRLALALDVDDLAAAVALAAGAAEAGAPEPVALGVTVLTSDPDASAFPARLEAAVAGGCGGVVCSVRELGVVKQRSPLLTVVPGIRLPGGPAHDQARVGTPAEAI